MLKLPPEQIKSQFDLMVIEHNGYTYAYISKGMYDLPHTITTEKIPTKEPMNTWVPTMQTHDQPLD